MSPLWLQYAKQLSYTLFASRLGDTLASRGEHLL
jgi:hypothetical protein